MTATKTKTQVKINVPTFVKRLRKTWDKKGGKGFAVGVTFDKKTKTPDIIGAGLTPKQLKVLSCNTLNTYAFPELVSDGLVSIDKRYVDRLTALQDINDTVGLTDSQKREKLRLKLRHLEASVQKTFKK